MSNLRQQLVDRLQRLFRPIFVAAVFGGSLVAAGLRIVWLCARPRWLLAVLIVFSIGGTLSSAFAVRAHRFPGWTLPIGVAAALGPLCWWLVWRWIFYSGPPPDLIRGPRVLDDTEEAIDAIARIDGLDRYDDSHRDEA